MSFVPERTMDRDTTRRLIRSLTWGQAIVTSTTATRCFWIRWLHLDPTLTRFALDRWTVDGRRAFALTALPLNTILWTLVATRVSYKRKRIQMLNIFFSIVCGGSRYRLSNLFRFVRIEQEKNVTRFLAIERMQFFFSDHRFIYRNRIHAVQETVTEILLLEDKAKYGKKIAFAKQMLASSSQNNEERTERRIEIS